MKFWIFFFVKSQVNIDLSEGREYNIFWWASTSNVLVKNTYLSLFSCEQNKFVNVIKTSVGRALICCDTLCFGDMSECVSFWLVLLCLLAFVLRVQYISLKKKWSHFDLKS